MKSIFKFLSVFVLTIFIYTGIAFAQGDVIVAPTQNEIQAFFASLAAIGGLKGAALIAVIVQGAMLFFRSGLANFAGKYKLLIVTGLTVAASIVSAMAQGQPIMAAVLSSGALAALQVFIHQIVNQIGKKE